MKPRLLDLFCGAGGAAMGYHRAGFEVVGVDIEPQPNYPFEFIEGDALEVPALFTRDYFSAVHASPPCQRFSVISAVYGRAASHPDLIPSTRRLLRETGLPYVIENVPGAPLEEALIVCGSSLGLPLKRHRLFESNTPLMAPPCAHGMHPKRYTIRQHGREIETAFCYVFGGGQAGQPVATWREAMDIDWMTVDELSEAIPPAYTELIGHQLLQHLKAAA